jgi:hypothetical protein
MQLMQFMQFMQQNRTVPSEIESRPGPSEGREKSGGHTMSPAAQRQPKEKDESTLKSVVSKRT